MKLDRDINVEGKGKYAIINLRKLKYMPTNATDLAAAILAQPECVEFGAPFSENEFFVLKLKDVNSRPALLEYANVAEETNKDYALSVRDLARRAGIMSPFCKKPD